MPRVERFGPSRVSTQVVQGARAQTLPQSAFGASQFAQAAQSFGQGLQQVGQRIDATAAEEALVAFERDSNKLFFDPEAGYFNTQGRTAFDEASNANESLEKLRQQYESSLTTEGAKQLFGRAAAAQITRANQNIMRHATKGLQSWEIATMNSQIENTVENASLYWNDPDKMQQQLELGRLHVRDKAKLEGIDSEALNERLQGYDSTFTATAIEAAAMQDAEQGQDLYDKHEKLLEGPDRLKLQKKIDTLSKQQLEQRLSTESIGEASRIVSDYDTRSEILEQVNQIEDEQLRKRTMQEAMYQFNAKRQAESEARGDAYETAEEFIRNGGSSQEFISQYPGQWDRLSPSQRTKINQGGVVSSDYALYSDLVLLPQQDLAKIDPTDYFDRLAATERKGLISAVRAARNQGSDSDKVESQAGRSRTAETSSAVQQIFGKKSKWNDKELAQVNTFYATLDDEVKYRESEKGAKLTSQEYTALLSDFTRKVVKEGLIFDSELDIADVPAEDIPTLSKFLRDNGVPVTADNLIRAYEQARQ